MSLDLIVIKIINNADVYSDSYNLARNCFFCNVQKKRTFNSSSIIRNFFFTHEHTKNTILSKDRDSTITKQIIHFIYAKVSCCPPSSLPPSRSIPIYRIDSILLLQIVGGPLLARLVVGLACHTYLCSTYLISTLFPSFFYYYFLLA